MKCDFLGAEIYSGNLSEPDQDPVFDYLIRAGVSLWWPSLRKTRCPARIRGNTRYRTPWKKTVFPGCLFIGRLVEITFGS
jgi:hypothetical protein